MTRFPDPDFTPPSPPFHVPHTVLYTKYPSKSCSSVVGGREKRARAFSRVSCACAAKHTRKESGAPDTQGIRPYALCVTLFNVSRRLILWAYCVVIGGIPTHGEGILMGHEVAKSQVVKQTRTTSLTELHLDLITYPPMTFSKVVRLLGYMRLHPPGSRT